MKTLFQNRESALSFVLNTLLQAKYNIINDLHTFSKEEIGVEVMRHFTSEDISIEELKRIVRETLDFDFPLKGVSKDVFSLELFHGPTMAFKDVGARFMSRSLRAIAER